MEEKDYTRQTIKITSNMQVCNITECMKKASASIYTAPGGYAITKDYRHLIVMRNSSVEDDTDQTNCVIAYGDGAKSVTSLNVSTKKALKHGNGAALAKGYLYVAQGGGSNFDNKIIKRFHAQDLGSAVRFPYQGSSLNNVGSIAYTQKNYFILGSGNHHAICQIPNDQECFQELASFDLDMDQIEIDGFTELGQGTYYSSERNLFYKIYAYRVTGTKIIKNNKIFAYKLSHSKDTEGKTIIKSDLKHEYTIEAKTGCTKFELEGISSAYNTTGSALYIAVNEATQNGQSDSIYKLPI